ncbi:MAG: DnaJ domain-containing protein [Gammaproteobacteria bacterium]|nr:DnaJ domain-containing protein [Gammaproteobacteria bacterium]
MHNPLIPAILELLRQQPLGLSEYEIFKGLGEHTAFSDIGDRGQLPLFQKHFMIMNGLYQLQQNLWNEEQLILEISPLKIVITAVKESRHNSHPIISESIKLREYYLDWNNLEETTEEDVLKLHQNFWDRFNQQQGRGDALSILELDESATRKTVIERYRKLAAEHHPDRGGCGERFIEIRRAYEILKGF